MVGQCSAGSMPVRSSRQPWGTKIPKRMPVNVGQYPPPVRISVIGTGYLGAVHAACMADLGHTVVAVDVDEEKVASLAAARAPFYEPGLDDLLERTLATGRLTFTSDFAALADADVHFICVGTPQQRGEFAADLTYVDSSVDLLAPYLTRPTLVVGKSTVPVGTAARLAARLAARWRPPVPTCSWPGTPSSCARGTRSRTP